MNHPIRSYEPHDQERIVAIWEASSRIATPFLSEDFMAKTRQQIREVWLPTAETWVFEENARVIGFVTLIGNEIGGIFVDPTVQGKGVGRSLMDWASLHHEPLLVEVFAANTIGFQFYERYGFRETNRYHHKPTNQVMIRMICMG
ncbi:MAG: GNAT family N-acetyltransferase [Bacteroidetes bacterium]|nr:GNAT family N-acetyltransferase [Bacteroidota bacterium]MDA0874099.1 GNAT family N-acetyltransferase [Bacteroidota bacterium]